MKGNKLIALAPIIVLLLLIGVTLFPGCIGFGPACQPSPAPQGQGSMQPGTPGQNSPAIMFSADRQLINPGECVTLAWDVVQQGVFLVNIDGQQESYSGQKQVCPTQSTVYLLEADIGTRMERREVLVQVSGTPLPPGAQGMAPGQPQQPGQQPPAQPAPGALPSGCNGAPHLTVYEVVPSAIQQGQAANINWGKITNGPGGPLVGTVTISPGGPGNLGSPGSMQVSPSATTTYTLTAAGCGGTATASVTLTVVPAGNPLPQLPPGSSSWSGPMLIVPGTLVPSNPPGGNSWSGPQPNPPGGNAWGGPNSPGTIYNFMLENNCTSASWYATPPYPYIKKQKHPNDKFPATWMGVSGQKDAEYYEYSYTRWLYDGDALEDGSICTMGRPAILMRPPWDSSSLIHGTYKMSNYTIGEKDYLAGEVGYMNGVSPGMYVTADFKAWFNWVDNSPAEYVTVVWHKAVTGKLESFKIPLGNTWKGRAVSSISLEVFAPYGTQDIRTVWVDTKVVRE